MSVYGVRKWLLPGFPDNEKLRQKWWHKGVVVVSMVAAAVFILIGLRLFMETYSYDLVLAITGSLLAISFGLLGPQVLYRIFLLVMEKDFGEKL